MTSDAEWFLDPDNPVAKRVQKAPSFESGICDESGYTLAERDCAALLERGRRLAREYQPLACFWELLSERLFDGYAMDGADIYELGEQAGLLVYEQYDPQGRHKGLNIPDVIEGDMFYLLKSVADKLHAEEAQDEETAA